VLDAQGNPVQTLALTRAGVTIGRLANNALRLDAPVVSRTHARIDWDGARVMVTDLGSKSGAQLGTMRLSPQTPQVWDPAQTLQIGPYTLRLHIGAPAPADPAPPVTGDLHAAPTQKVREAGLSVALSPAHTALTLIPGEPTSVEVRVTNRTNAPQTVALALSGLPEAWVEPAPTLRVAPFSMKTASIRVQAPASPEALFVPMRCACAPRLRKILSAAPNCNWNGESRRFWRGRWRLRRIARWDVSRRL
jgi:FOG: FHA domain